MGGLDLGEPKNVEGHGVEFFLCALKRIIKY